MKNLAYVLIACVVIMGSNGCAEDRPMIKHRWISMNTKRIAHGDNFEMKKAMCEAKAYALPRPESGGNYGGGFAGGFAAGSNMARMRDYHRIKNNFFKACMYKAGYKLVSY